MTQGTKSIRIFLIIALLAVNLCMAALLWYSISELKNQQEREVRSTIENLARLLDQNLAASTSNIDWSLRDIADLLEENLRQRGKLDGPTVNALLESRRNWLSGLADFRVTDAEGIVRYGRGVVPESKVSYADRDYFAAHRDHADSGLIVSNPLLGRISKTWLISFTRRYNFPDGRFAGIITAAVPVSHFEKLLSQLDLGPQGVALLRDSNTALITRYPHSAHPGQQIGTKTFSKELADIIASGATTATYHTWQTGEGNERTNTYRRLTSVPFHLVAGMGAGDYLVAWQHSVRKALFVAAIFLTITTMLAWLLWRSITLTAKASERSQLLLKWASDGIHILDENGNVIEASESFCAMLGYARAELIGMNVARWDAEFAPEELKDVVAKQFKCSEISTFETRHRRRDGSVFDVEVTGHPLRLDGRVVLYNSARDITARKQAEAELKQHRDHLEKLVDERTAELSRATENMRIAATAFDSQQGILVADADTVILRANKAFTEITGYTAEEVVGRKTNVLKSGRHDQAFYAALWNELGQQGVWQGEMWNRRKSGELYPQWLTITAVKGEAGAVTHYVAAMTDITQRKAAEEEINHLAFYDALTQLPNRRLLQDRLRQALAAGTRSGCQGALLFIDLDNFKTLNDTLGHEIGDLLLQQVAQRLGDCVRASDTVARLGGDEFVIMLVDLSKDARDAASQAEVVGRKVIAALNQPYQLDKYHHRSTPSLGITLFNGQQDSIDELLKRADLAMYQAKADGRNTLRFFDPEMQAAVTARAALEDDLRQGLLRNEFILYYQCQVGEGGSVTGAEALVRWRHPERGLVSPLQFIPIAEESGLILPLGQRVLESACAQLVAWAARAETRHLSLAVNVSARQFHHPDFVEQVLAVLDQSGADPQKLQLELTESVLLDDAEDAIAKIMALKGKGLSFSLDDFGTGFSSLAYLKRLPLDELKIDRSFVRDILTDPNDAAITRTIIALANSMGLGVIAEGVETKEQRSFLVDQGCHAFQGYLFGQPLPVEDFERLACSEPRVGQESDS